MRTRTTAAVLTGIALAWLMPADNLAAARQSEIFTGMVANLGPGPTAGSLQITIDKWTSAEQRQALATTLVEKKQDGLLSALQKVDQVGFARFPGTLGWPIRYAWQFEQDGKRVVRLLTDRPIAFVEARAQTRTMDYPFGIIQMNLDAQGKGEGVVYSAASLKVNKDGVLEVESYGIGPQRFLSITTEKK